MSACKEALRVFVEGTDLEVFSGKDCKEALTAGGWLSGWVAAGQALMFKKGWL